MTLRLLSVLLLAACGVAEPTAIELRVAIPSELGITQLRISGASGDVEAFEPGLAPEIPRILAGDQTAILLLPDALDGSELALRVDAMASGQLIRTGAATTQVVGNELHSVDILLGAPAVCGDGIAVAPFETCSAADASALACIETCTAKELTSFAFLAAHNPRMTSDGAASILGNYVVASFSGSSRSTDPLVATFATTGVDVTVDGVSQQSGVTDNDFAAPVSYTVRAGDDSTRRYTAYVVRSQSDKQMLMFGFEARKNPVLSEDVIGEPDGSKIYIQLPQGIDRSSLVATFVATGPVTVDGQPHISGETRNDFSQAVTYRVGQTGSTDSYTVQSRSD